MNLGRFIIGLIITYGMWHWYNTNVLSKLDIESQLIEYQENHSPSDYDVEEYDYADEDERERDSDYAYDDYDTGSDY